MQRLSHYRINGGKRFQPELSDTARASKKTLGIAWPDGLYQGERTQVPFTIDFVPQPNGVEADIQFKQVSFSDESGLHAGEKLTGNIKLSAQLVKSKWSWKGVFNWKRASYFWQPFYFGQAGNQFDIQGTYQAPMLNIQRANLQIDGVGQLSAGADVSVC